MEKLMAFLLSIVYFFASFGLGAKNPAAEITVTDANGNAVANVSVFFKDDSVKSEVIAYTLIGETDENGKVMWDDREYGNVELVVTNGDVVMEENLGIFTVKISRFKNEPITLQLKSVVE